VSPSLRPDELPRFAELEAEYEILQELGRGGTAVVYLAREREVGRDVAIKVVRSTYVEDPDAAARLMREARTIAALQHPNIVLLYGTRRLGDGSLALIMQYVPGRTLRSEIQAARRLTGSRAEQILRDLARALEHAHGHGIIHRDIKPENIYIDERTGAARLSDFGIARPLTAESNLTLPGTAIGTPAYMSPEQIDGSALDGRSDLYSLGLIGHEMLTGRQPWAGSSLYGMIYKQKHEPLPSPALERDDVSPALLLALEGVLRKEPSERLSSAAEFMAVLAGRWTALGPTSRPGLTMEPGSAPASAAAVPEDGATIQFRRDGSSDPVAGLPAPAAVGLTARPALEPSRPVATATEDSSAGLAAVAEADAPSGNFFSRLSRPVLRAAVIVLLLGGVASGFALTLGPGETVEDRSAPGAVLASEPVPAAVPASSPAAALAVSGAVQEGLAGDTLPQWLVVRVQDEAGNPVPGANVTFAVASGAGALSHASARTDELGLAGTRWLLAAPGLHSVRAEVRDRPELAATFMATARARPAGRLVAVTQTELEPGAAGPLEVRVEDERGAPVAGAQVRFTVTRGGGRVAPAAAVTDSMGLAQAEWTPGASGAQEARATVPDAPSLLVRFTAGAPAPTLSVRAGLAAGGTHSCALTREGTAMCWGGNDSGQLGNGSRARGALPVRVAATEPLALISAGVSHTCGVSTAGSAFCWGANADGQLGDGSRAARAQPVRVGSGRPLTTVAAGSSHSCGVDVTGTVLCWGSNAHGQLGDGTRTSRVRPVAVRSGVVFRSVTAGWSHTCALSTDGRAYCWGRGQSGELGNGRTGDSVQPVQIGGDHRFRVLAAGSAHTCGLRTDGEVMCWGQNTHGQLGTAGGGSSRTLPILVPSDAPFSAVEAGGVHTCALTRDGVAFCWGRNVYGQLGDGTEQDRPTPVPVAGGLRFTALHASGAHTCGTASDGGAYCWGFNIEGQLGDRTRTNQARPVPVDRPW
jgi:alpha-tubulin suppressor-like RCC1 family protein/predicted Ser/Thr protein kinase